jgi:hypothetical protein
VAKPAEADQHRNATSLDAETNFAKLEGVLLEVKVGLLWEQGKAAYSEGAYASYGVQREFSGHAG